MEITIGCELEAGLVDEAGKPAVTLSVLKGVRTKTGKPFEEITNDLSESSVEMISTICTSGKEIEQSLSRARALLPKGYRLVYKALPFGKRAYIADKPRYGLVNDALLKEHRNGMSSIYVVAPWCATQYHIGVRNVRSEESVLLQNVLNKAAPYARLAMMNKYEVVSAPGQPLIWAGWCLADRVLSPRWFDSLGEMLALIGRIPKLVESDGEGGWRHAENKRSQLGDPESEGTIWWIARPRGVYNTIEWRCFPSVSIPVAAALADDILNLVRAYYDHLSSHSISDVKTEKGRRHLFKSLSEASYLMPSTPLSDENWWQLCAK